MISYVNTETYLVKPIKTKTIKTLELIKTLQLSMSGYYGMKRYFLLLITLFLQWIQQTKK